MATTTFGPLLETILAVLCDGYGGSTRTIAPGHFQRWTERSDDRGVSPAAAYDVPMVSLRLGKRRRPDEDAPNLSGDRHLMQAEIVVRVIYGHGGGDYLGPPDGGDRRSLIERMADDTLAITYALENYLGAAMRTSPRAADTGLLSGVLVYLESDEPEWRKDTVADSHRFLAEVEIEPA